MKKIILTFLTGTLLVTGTHAQSLNTLTREGNAYRPGDRIVKQQVEFKDPGAAGRNITWDFSMLQPVNEEYKLRYFLPDSLRFPDKICGLEHNTRYYYRQRNDTLITTGFENATTLMQYTQPELRMKYPFNYGDTLYSAFTGEGEYSHTFALNVKGFTRVMADAEGDLMLPGFETVKKALRVRTLRHYTETGKDSVEMILDTYAWYAAGVRYPVFESIRTSLVKKLPSRNTPSPQGEGWGEVREGSGGEVDTTVFNTSFFYPPELQCSQLKTDTESVTPLAGEQEGASAVFTEASYLPNPVVDNLTINYKLTRNARVWFTLHTNAGIPVCQTPAQNLSEGFNNTSINMSYLMTGTYTLYVHVDDMVMRQVIVKL